MTPEVIQLHPDVEAILREVAAQPGSVLLRVPRSPDARAFSPDAVQVGASDSWLSSAERHLLQVHSEELAFALRQAAWMRLATGNGRQRVNRTVTAHCSVPIPSLHDVRVSAARALEGRHVAQAEPEVIELLEALVAPEGPGRVDPTRLLVAGHRLVPSARGRILAGSAHALAGRTGSAQMCFADAVRTRLPAELQAVAWNNMADVLEATDEIERAMRAAARASRLMPGLVFAQAARLACALRLGDQAIALDASRILDAIAIEDAGALDELELRWQERRAARLTALPIAERRAMVNIRENAGPGTRRLIDALA